jgi:hypothetical protein
MMSTQAVAIASIADMFGSFLFCIFARELFFLTFKLLPRTLPERTISLLRRRVAKRLRTEDLRREEKRHEPKPNDSEKLQWENTTPLHEIRAGFSHLAIAPQAITAMWKIAAPIVNNSTDNHSTLDPERIVHIFDCIRLTDSI